LNKSDEIVRGIIENELFGLSEFRRTFGYDMIICCHTL
jgi:hypothetical protein